MSRIAVVCIVFCLAIWGINAAAVPNPTNQTPPGGEPSYAVDLYRPQTQSTGFLDVSPIQLGNGQSTTLEIEVFPRTATACILSMGEPGTDNFVALQLDGGNLVVRIGSVNQPNSRAISTGSPIKTNSWTTLSVVITNNDASSATVTAYANGAVIINGATTRALTANTRKKVLIGRCQYRAGLGDGQGPQELNGIVDNFRVWDLARSVADIQAFATLISTTVDLDNPAGLIVHFPFVEGVGATSVGYAGQIANNYYVASFANDAVWVVKNAGDIHRTCSSAGDPHVAIRVPGQGTICFDPPHVVGQWQLTSCGNNFIVRTYHAPVRNWDLGEGCDEKVCGATINNAFTVRAFDDVFYVNIDGNFFIKKLFDTTFTSLPVGAGVRPSGTRYNIQSNKVMIEVPAAGYLNADIRGLGRGGTYADIYIYHTLACETLGVNGLCANQDQRVTWNQFLFLDNATPLPEPGEVPPRNFDPCDNLPADLRAVLKPQAETACASTIDQEAFPDAYADCIFDVCASGDISVATNINDDGSCRLAEILAAQTGETPPTCNTRAQCPNSCSGHGTCGTSGCTCLAGYVGPDCARPAEFPCFNVVNGNELPLNPWVFQTSTIGTIAESDFFTFWNTWHTEDGVLLYFAKVEASQSVFTYNLFVSNDAPNADGGSYTLTITAPSAWYSEATPQGTGVNVQSTGTQTIVSFTWEAFRANGIIFKNVDTSVARTLSVQITGHSGIRQVSVGANSLRAELDVLAVDYDFSLTAGTCDDECAVETDCEACAAKPQCGWCRSSGQCFLGGPSGPRAATCQDWKFSTDALVARRLTASFGYPVNPDTNTAYLPVNAVNDLDVDLFVSMGNKETIKWDMALVLGASGLTNADDRTNWLVDFGGLTSVFRLFPDLGFSLGTYNSVNNNKFTLVSALVDAASVTSDVLRSWVYAIPLTEANNDAATSALATLTNPSFGLNWRTNTRRMITIYVDQLPVFGTGLTPTAEELRQSLLNFRVLPVFLATSNVQAAWENVVSTELGFGLVIPVQADSGDLAFAITKAINLATSQISLITDLTSEGHVIDKFAQSVTGLSSNMRARFSVPFRAESADAKTTNLIAPGFGAATVTNVLNDSPLATIRNIKLTEDNFDNDYRFNGTVFRLAGIASNGVDPVLAEVIATPTVGGLYQFDAAGPKPAKLITAVPVLVSDPQGRVIYLAPPDASNNGDNQFDQFTYRVRDACAWSDNVDVRVDVIGVNDRPWTQMAAPIGDEDVPVELTFNFFDREGDSADAYISELPYDVLVTGERVLRGKLYQYSAAVLAGDLTGAVEIQAGDRVTDNRAVYIGWLNSNTERKPPVLFSQPYFTYYVKETTCCQDNSCNQNECVKLTSWPETVQIFLRAVNDAPVIIKDSDLVNYNFTAVPCFSDCTFLEDNGARYPDLAQPVHVWLGGGDIELDQLKAAITALELPAAASLTDLSGNTITVGSAIGPFAAGSLQFNEGTGNWFPVGTLFPALRFTPGLDENNNANGYYAKITYKVNDGDKDSVETKTITIRITPVNDLPRSTIVTTYTGPVPTNQPGVLAVPHIITLMNTPANFTITGTDPESDPVTPVISSCFALGGKVELLNNNAWVTINCSRTTTLPTKPSGSIWQFRYTPPTNVAADSLQVITYQLQDGSNDNRVGVDDWVVTIDVIAVNQAPTLKLDNNAPSSNLVLATNVGVGLPLNYNLTLADPDVESGTMLFTATLVCVETRPENCAGRIVVTDIASGTVITRTNTNIVIRGMIFDLQVVLRTFNFISTKISKYNLTVTINDNGNLGVCPPVPGANTIVRFCPLQANLNAVITVDDGGSINTIVIASVAGAAAAAGIALAAGFASRLNKKAQSAQYTPWEINDMDRGISNPLHESPTVEMSNPLHEGPGAMNE